MERRFVHDPDPEPAVSLRRRRNFGRLRGGGCFEPEPSPENTKDGGLWWPVSVAGMQLHALYRQHGVRALCTTS